MHVHIICGPWFVSHSPYWHLENDTFFFNYYLKLHIHFFPKFPSHNQSRIFSERNSSMAYRIQGVTKPNPLNIKRRKHHRRRWPHHQIRNQRHPELIIPARKEPSISQNLIWSQWTSLSRTLPSYSFNNSCSVMQPLRLAHSSQEADISSGSRYNIKRETHRVDLRNIAKSSRGNAVGDVSNHGHG